MKFRSSIKILTLVFLSLLMANGDLYGQSRKQKKAQEKAKAARAARNAAKAAETKTLNSDSTNVETQNKTSQPINTDNDVIIVDGDNSRSGNSRRTVVEEKKFSDRLWYGAGGALNFQGSSGRGSSFLIGLSPMVGFKITEHISVGPRAEINYSSVSVSPTEKVNSISVGAGLFARAKFFQVVFLHAEYDFVWDDEFFRDQFGEIFSERVREARMPLGIGYNNGYGNLGYEISLLYDVLDKEEGNIPIYYRAGLTYRF